MGRKNCVAAECGRRRRILAAPNQPVVEAANDYFWVGIGLGFVLMIMAGYVLNAVLRDRGFGTFGNGAFLFVGLALGVNVMKLAQRLLM
jgi:hypothetical protein